MGSIANLLIYLMCAIAGCFFSVMIFTIIENMSAGFRKVVEGYTKIFSPKKRAVVAIFVGIGSLILVYNYVNIGPTRAGILAGAIVGIPIYFKSGVTMGETFYMGPKYTKKEKTKDKKEKGKKEQRTEVKQETKKSVPKLKDIKKGSN
ncbi:MAG: hypothetical protein RR495_05315 [Anaerovoracaceae bacterium]